MIRLEEVSRVYRMGDTEVRALDHVSLAIDEHEFLAVMGSSGSGKSTLMNVLGCLDRPSEGRYRLDGQEVSGLGRNELAAVRNRTIGFVFQSFNLLARTTAIENVELPMLYAGLATSERRRRAAEALERVGLEMRMDHMPNQLSGGQQQRVAIARAIANGPRLILADEPTGNLDSKTTIEIMELFRELSETGITIIVVTHEPDVAQFGSRMIWMKDGQVDRDEVRS